MALRWEMLVHFYNFQPGIFLANKLYNPDSAIGSRPGDTQSETRIRISILPVKQVLESFPNQHDQVLQRSLRRMRGGKFFLGQSHVVKVSSTVLPEVASCHSPGATPPGLPRRSDRRAVEPLIRQKPGQGTRFPHLRQPVRRAADRA